MTDPAVDPPIVPRKAAMLDDTGFADRENAGSDFRVPGNGTHATARHLCPAT